MNNYYLYICYSITIHMTIIFVFYLLYQFIYNYRYRSEHNVVPCCESYDITWFDDIPYDEPFDLYCDRPCD